MLLKKGEISMENSDIRVVVKRDVLGGKETASLIFEFENSLELNLSSDDSEATKKFFEQLLGQTLTADNDYAFCLDDQQSDLFHDVAVEYIKDLQQELADCKAEFKKLLKDMGDDGL